MAALKYAILALVVGTAAAQIVRPGPCPPQAVVHPFDVRRYMGKWYQVEAYLQVYSIKSVCASAYYSNLGEGTFTVRNVAYDHNTFAQTSIEGTARFVEGTDTGKLATSFPITPAESPYWILETDYDNFAVVWSCGNFGIFHLETVWFMSRERQPKSHVQKQVRSILSERNISPDDLIPTQQYNCPED